MPGLGESFLFALVLKSCPVSRCEVFSFCETKNIIHKSGATVEINGNDQSIFQYIDRKFFAQLVANWEMDKGIRSFSTWEMTCALATCMALRLGSYREVEQTLGVPKSTLGDAMSERSYAFFQELCDHVLLQIKGRTPHRKLKRGIRELLAIDSSECRVHGSLFSFPQWKLKKTKGHESACKFHAVYNIDKGWIDDFKVTGGLKGDSLMSLRMKLHPNKTYVFDRAYNDLDFWLKIIDVGAHFVTRLKEYKKIIKLQVQVLKEKKDANGLLYDGFYEFGAILSFYYRERLEGKRFRHIVYRDELTQKVFHFVTSDLESPAQLIADIYKRRWAVELLFRWLKGHLDIRYLAVKSTNAVRIQLAIAVLVQLLLLLKKMVMNFSGTLWELLRKIRTHHIRQTLCAGGSPDDCRWKDPPTAQTQVLYF